MDHRHAFERVQSSFARALRLHPHLLSERDYRFGGKPVRFRILGRQLAAHVMAPFDHLRASGVAPGTPELVVELWDQEETGIPGPEGVRGAPADGEDPFTWSVSPDTRLILHEQRDGVVLFDRCARRVVGWRTRACALSMAERTRPLAWSLTTWYHDQSIQVVHAGLVARDRQGVLLAGPGGAGKSTSTLACLSAGFDVLGDDQVGVLPESGGGHTGISLYSAIRLETDQLAQLPSVARFALPSTDPGDRKSLLLLARIRQQISHGQLPASVPIRALMLPRIAGADRAQVHRCSGAAALRALAPTSILLIGPGMGRQGLSRLRWLVESVPCYWLELGRDLSSIPACIEQALVQPHAL